MDNSGGVLSADVHPLEHHLPGDLCQVRQMADLPVVLPAPPVLQTTSNVATSVLSGSLRKELDEILHI